MTTKNNTTKAVAIAKDVIKLIKSKRVEVQSSNGYMFTNNGNMDNAAFEYFKGVPLKSLLPLLVTEKNPCEVCALGACFLAHVEKYNEAVVKSDWAYDFDRADITSQLADTFTLPQMKSIEDAFETDPQDYESECDSVAVKFGRKYEDDDERLIAIMKNIIKNKGTFKPEQVNA